MHLRTLRLATTIVAITLTAAACGGESSSPARTSTARPATATAPAPASTSSPATATALASTVTSRPTAPVPRTTPTPPVPATPSGATMRVRAPIDAAEMIVRESFPVQYAVRIASGLPSGCHAFDGAEVTRNGTEITIAVWNRLPADPQLACTAIYGTHEEIVELGSDFRSGVVYRVAVNDRALTFTAQ